MTRSGIKQGLAISAVSALSVVGLPAAAHAAAYPAGTYTVSLSRVDSGNVDDFGTATYKVTVHKGTSSAGAGDVAISLSEAAPAGTTPAAGTYFKTALATGSNGTVVAATPDAGADAKWDGTTTVTTGTDGTATFTVQASNVGSVQVSATVPGVTSNTYNDTFNVTGGKSGAANVAKVSVPATLAAYSVDFGATTGAFDVNLQDSNGGAILDPANIGTALNYEITAPDGTKTKGSAAGLVNAADAVVDGVQAPVSAQFNLYKALGNVAPSAGTYAVKFWVDETPSSGTANPGSYDANEPTASTTINVSTPPATPITGVKYTVTANEEVAPTGAAATVLPADGAAGTATVKIQTVPAVAGANLEIELASSVTNSALNSSKRIAVTTDATGAATFTINYAKGDAVNLESITFDAFESSSSVKGTGTDLSDDASAEIDFASRIETLKVPTDLQVAVGGNVSIPVTLADQFGKGYADTLEWSFDGTTRNSTTDGFPVQFSTDASGKATISYTDKGTATADNGDVVTVVDHVAGASPISNGITGASTNVDFLTNLTADANQSSGSNPVGAAAANGTPAYTDVVGANLTQAAATPADLAYTVNLKNSDGTPLVGSPVKFNAAGGVLADPIAGTFGVGTITAKTDGSGNATVVLSAVQAGKVTVSASAGNFSKTFNPVAFVPGAAYSISLVSAPESITAGTTQKFIYKVTDAFGNPIAAQADALSGNWDLGSDGVVGGTGVNADTLKVSAWGNTSSVTDPGAAVNTSLLDSTSQFSVTFLSAESEKGAGHLVVTPTGVWASKIDPSALGLPASGVAALSAVLKPYTDPAKGFSTAYTVDAPVVAPPKPPVDHTHDNDKAASVKGHGGKRDVLHLTGKVGQRVVIRVHGKKVGTATIGSNGKATIRVKDKNGKKLTKYVARIGGVKKSVKVK